MDEKMNPRIREAVEDAHRRCQSHDGSIGCAALHQAIRSLARVVVEEAAKEADEVSTGDRGIERHEVDAWLRGSNSTRAGIVAAIRALLGEEAAR